MAKPTTKSSATLAQLVAAKLAISGLRAADAKRLLIRPVTAAEVAALPNAPIGAHNAGALLPYFDVDGKRLSVEDHDTGRIVHMYRVRYLPPLGTNGFAAASGIHPQKYTQPARVGCPPYLPPLIDWQAFAADTSREIWITEGELKAASATKYGQPCLGTGGVWNFKGKDTPLHPLFNKLNLEGRRVVVVRDSDYVTNHNVRYGGDFFARALSSAGAQLLTLTIPPLPGLDKCGLDDFLQRGGKTPQQALTVLRDFLQPWVPTTLNDTGLAMAFKQLNRERLFFATNCNAKNNHWRYWDGKCWVPSEQRALELTNSVHGQLVNEAATLKDEDARKQALRWAMRSGDRAKRENTLALAEVEMDKNISQLDANPYLLNLQNGVLDLKTFKCAEHDPALMQGRISSASFDPKATAPEFEKFIRTILPNRPVRDFVQRLAGYYLIGGNPERVFVNFWGNGRNGKTQLKELMLYCSGDYARACSPDAFLAGRRTGAVRDDLHALRGARLVAAVEPNKAVDLDEATVKEVTGGDTISTRALYGTYDDWKVEFKPLLVSNHKVTVRGTDDGIWDRLVIVPLIVRISDKDVVPEYFENRLKPEVDGYLQWALAGLREYWRNGLQIPAEVRALVKEHREESDVVGAFLETRCVIDPKAMAKDCVSPDSLKAAFVEYCAQQRITIKGVDLKQQMERLGHVQRKGDDRYWVGVRLRMPKDFLAEKKKNVKGESASQKKFKF